MALTIRSVLGVGKVVAPLAGNVIRLFGRKKSAAVKVADKVEILLATNPKKVTGGLAGAIAVVVAALGAWLYPEQWAQVVEFLSVYVKPALEALTAESP